MRQIFSHEDDHCQIELVAIENLEFCRKQLGQIERFAEEHRADVGFTDIFVRGDNPVPLTAVGIDRSDFSSLVESAAPAYQQVLSGYGEHQTPSPDSIAFGHNEQVVVYADCRADGIIESIWLSLTLLTHDDLPHATQMMQSIRNLPLILIDWGWGELIRLDDSSSMAEYLAKRLDVFSDIQRDYERDRDG